MTQIAISHYESLADCELLHLWIKANKPSFEEANDLSRVFIEKSAILGGENFSKIVAKVIEKAAYFATGKTILERILRVSEKILIVEGEVNEYVDEDFLINGEKYRGKISLSFGKIRECGVTYNWEGERKLAKLSKVAILIHEGLHKWHCESDPENFFDRMSTESFWPDMGNREEEFTILGDLHLRGKENISVDFCCECTANIELEKPARISYRAVSLPKDRGSGIFHMVGLRALGSLRAELIKHPTLHQNYPEPHLKTPLDLAMYRKFMESDLMVEKEWSEIIRLLIRSGFKSAYALKLAVLQNFTEAVKLFIEAGVKPSLDLLEIAMLSSVERCKIIEKLLTNAGYLKEASEKEELSQKFKGLVISHEIIQRLQFNRASTV